MIELRMTTAVALTGAALMLAPAGVSAQYRATVYQPKAFDVAVQAGAAIPADHLQDFTNVGLNLGADAAWHLTNRFAIRVDGDYDALPGQKNIPIAPAHGMPDVSLMHLGGGLELDFGGVRTAATPWFVTTDVGAGFTNLRTQAFLHADGSMSDVTKTYPDVDAGVELGYHVGHNMTAAIGGEGLLAFTKKSDLASLTEIDPAGTPFNQALVFPVTASISVALPH
jgi:hypothetical protein